MQRDRHAAFLAALAITGGSIERFANEVRNLQHTEIAELRARVGTLEEERARVAADSIQSSF